MADFTRKYEKAPKGTLKRNKVIPLKLSKDELDLLDILVNVIAERRNIAPNRPGLLVYLLERAYEKEQAIEMFNDDKYRNDGKKKTN